MNPLCCGCLSPSLFVFFSPVPYCWLPLLHSASSCEGKVYSVFKTCSLFSLVGVKLGEGQSKVPPCPLECSGQHSCASALLPAPSMNWEQKSPACVCSKTPSQAAHGEISWLRFYTINTGNLETFSHGSNCIAPAHPCFLHSSSFY